MPYLRSCVIVASTVLGLAASGILSRTSAQTDMGETCKPVSGRTGELGCWIVADQPIGQLTASQAFWHLDTYPTAEAAAAAKGPRGVVITALGETWLLSIEESKWQAPAGGEHVATIGPLPIDTAKTYSAQYMEAIFTPGMASAIHDHTGPRLSSPSPGRFAWRLPRAPR